MKINLSGTIKSRKRIHYGRQECYGITRANRGKFSIYLSESAMEDGYIFSETILHELLHLWFFIIGSISSKKLSEKEQHEVLEEAIPRILSRTGLILERKVRK